MSIKRTKQRTFRSDENASSFSFNEKPPEIEKSWEEYVNGQPDEAFLSYSYKQRFVVGNLINHPKFGKGAVVNTDQKNMDVVFADGKKKLGHGLGE